MGKFGKICLVILGSLLSLGILLSKNPVDYPNGNYSNGRIILSNSETLMTYAVLRSSSDSSEEIFKWYFDRGWTLTPGSRYGKRICLFNLCLKHWLDFNQFELGISPDSEVITWRIAYILTWKDSSLLDYCFD